MTRRPPSSADPSEELARRGLRATRQRVAVLRFLQSARGHPTAPEIHRKLLRHHANLSQKTVYEILDALVDHGLVTRVSHGGAAARYEVERERHYHAECRVCGRLFDVAPSADGPIRGRSSLPKGFLVEDIQVRIEGCCLNCRDEI